MISMAKSLLFLFMTLSSISCYLNIQYSTFLIQHSAFHIQDKRLFNAAVCSSKPFLPNSANIFFL